MEQWTAKHRAFVVEAYFKNGDSAVTTRQLFRRHFNIPRHGCVPCRPTIKEWVQNFQENASALKRKAPGINECFAGNVSTTRHFPWRQCSMAGTFA
jgi:hypothetical protein